MNFNHLKWRLIAGGSFVTNNYLPNEKARTVNNSVNIKLDKTFQFVENPRAFYGMAIYPYIACFFSHPHVIRYTCWIPAHSIEEAFQYIPYIKSQCVLEEMGGEHMVFEPNPEYHENTGS